MNQNEVVQWKQKFIMEVPLTIAQAKKELQGISYISSSHELR